MAAGAGTLAFTGAILAAGFGGAGDVRADALCDQMRAQYGPSWPCISVPTYTPPPTMNAPTTTPGAPGTSNGGAVIGGDAGPGPGTGNGTPIVGGQPTDQNRPDRAGGPTGPRTPAPATVTPNRPGQPSDNDQTPGRTQAPAGVPVKQSEQSPSDQAYLSPASDDDGGLIPLPVWAIAGAAAVAAASPRARSLLSRGGSTRATVGPSRMVLIHDESSPTTYRFAMNVPEGGYTKVNSDGSATVYDKDGNAVRQVARPWAFDAAGRPQKTWYTVDENGDLIQHVEPAENALFPILADPTSVGVVDTTGRGDGDTWNQDLGNGETATHTIVDGTGGQSVDTRITRTDGTYTDVRTVSDGEGGWTAWSNNSDGTSSYANKQGADGNHYTEHYDPAYQGGQAPMVTSQSDSTNDQGTITANNLDGTQSTGTYDRVADNRYQLDTNNPDGTTSAVDSTIGPDGAPNTMVTDANGSRVSDGDGHVVAVDGRGNELHSGKPGDPATGRFYDPVSGTWQDGAVNPDTGERVYRLDNGSLLIENRTEDGDPIWTTRSPNGDVRIVTGIEWKDGKPGGIDVVAQPIGQISNAGNSSFWDQYRGTIGGALIGGQLTLNEFAINPSEAKMKDFPRGTQKNIIRGLRAGGFLGSAVVGTLADAEKLGWGQAATTNIAGAAAGTGAGIAAAAGVGATIGSAVPGLGTAVGFAVGYVTTWGLQKLWPS